MKNTIKKISAFLLSLVLLLGIVPLADLDITASAETYSGTCGDNLTWTLDTETGELVISGSGEMDNWTEYVPSPWYYDHRSNIKMVTISDGVISIGDYAFSYCPKLTSIEIPDSVTSIGKEALKNCGSLTNIIVDEANTVYSSDEYGVLFNKDKTVLIQYPIGNARTNYTIPDSATSIGDYAFYGSHELTNIDFSDSLTSIGHDAFSSCDSLTSVTIPSSVTSISSYAFNGCTSLADVYYNGTEKQWNEIAIGVYNAPLLNANIHFLEHECDYTAVVTPPTCQTQGYTTYTCEECGDRYVDDYTDTVDHYYLDGKCIWCGDTNVTPSSIIDITYTPSDSARKLFTVTCADRAQMIQFIEPDGGTRTYYRNNANVKITSYNADGEVVGELSRDLAYEVWEIYSNMSIGTTIKVRAKFKSRWELDKRSLVVYEYNPVISMELSRTSGKKGPVPATVVADEKTENVKFKMPNGTSVTVTQFTTDENGNRVFKGNAWANEDGLNVITVTIRRKNVTKTVGTLEYTVE